MGLGAATATLLLVVLLAGCGGGAGRTATRLASTTPGPVASPRPAKTARVAHPQTHGSHPQAHSSGARSPALRHMQALIVRAMGQAGANTGVLVYDLTAHQTLFTAQAGVARPPASVEKLYTSVALLRLLGPSARLHSGPRSSPTVADWVKYGEAAPTASSRVPPFWTTIFDAVQAEVTSL